MSSFDQFLHWSLAFNQFVTLCAYAVMTAGVALLQQKANNLPFLDGLTAAQTETNTQTYNEVFQSTTYIIPYPQSPEFQFQYQWWIIEFELFVFLLTLSCTTFPRIIPRMRPVALTFIAVALVLVMDNVNAMLFLRRNDQAVEIFDDYRIKTALAGFLMMGCCNGLTIIFLGAYAPTVHVPSSHVHVKANTANTANTGTHYATPVTAA